MLMDEPIGALDAKMRESMRTELKRLHLENASTTIYVTHDQVEAMSLADRIAVMDEGVLQQVGTPTDVYRRPRNLFVAQFIGSPVMNVLPGRLLAEGGRTKLFLADAADAFDFAGPVPSQGAGTEDGFMVGVRPEAVRVARDQRPGYVPIEAHLIEPLGAYDIVDLKLGSQFLRARTASGFVAGPGQTVWAHIEELQTHFFSSRSGSALECLVADMAHVKLEGITKSFGGHAAVSDLELEIEDGQFFVLLGPTGAGKTTTLRLIAGLERPDSGAIFLDRQNVNGWSPAQRDVALVLQQFSLYPRYTVRENLEFPLRSPVAPIRPSANRRAGRPRGGNRPGGTSPRSKDRPAVRRRDAARVDRPGDRAPAAHLSDGRTALQSGCKAARGASR